MTSTQAIPYEQIFDTYSSAYDSLTSLAEGYDNLITYGKQAVRQVRKAEKGLAAKTQRLFADAKQIVQPITRATLDTLKQAKTKLRATGKNVAYVGLGILDAIADSKNYTGMQDMYSTYSRTETADRTERLERETIIEQDTNPFTRIGKKIANVLKNAKDYRKIREFSGRITEAGLFATPLQAYALKNGNFEVYARLMPKEKQEPTITMNIGGVNYAFNDAKQFTDFVSGFYNFSAMADMFNGMNNSRTTDSEQSREPKDIDPKDITVSEPSYYRKPKALLTDGKLGGLN